jgi:hypothetical protein
MSEKELNSIIEDALNLRHSQDSQMKRYFESLPNCIQKTLFSPTNNSKRNVDISKEFLNKGKQLLLRNEYIEALTSFETGISNIWFVELRPNAPHWKDKGVRDEWIKVYKTKDILCMEFLSYIAECLFQLKQFNECISNADWVVRLDERLDSDEVEREEDELVPSLTRALLNRAKAYLKLNKIDSEEIAIGDLLRILEVNPGERQAKEMLLDLKNSAQKKLKNDKKVFGGLFNKPGVRLIEERTEEEMEEKLAKKRDLDLLEIEAAKQAGLDVTDPTIRELLIRLSTKEGQQLFEREAARLKKVELRNQAIWWITVTLFCGIILAVVLQLWLRSITINMPLEEFEPIKRLKAWEKSNNIEIQPDETPDSL